MFAEFLSRYGIILVAAIASIIGSSLMLIWYARRLVLLRKFGKNARGYVTKRHISRGRTTTYLVTVGFDTGALEENVQQHEAEQSVGESNYNRLTIGTPVTMRYVASNPKIARLAGKFTDNYGPNLAIFMFVVYIA